MKIVIIVSAYIAFLCLIEVNASLKIETTKKVECTKKTEIGDSLRIHYTVKLKLKIVLRTIDNFVIFVFREL